MNRAQSMPNLLTQIYEAHPPLLQDTDRVVPLSKSETALPPSRPSKVQFQTVQMRVFNRIAGDHPDVRHGGPPLSIGWQYTETQAMNVDDYEAQRQQERDSKKIHPQFSPEGVRRLASSSRRELLLNVFEIPPHEIAEAERAVALAKKQRQETNSQSRAAARREELLESAKERLVLKPKKSLLGGFGKLKKTRSLSPPPPPATATVKTTTAPSALKKRSSIFSIKVELSTRSNSVVTKSSSQPPVMTPEPLIDHDHAMVSSPPPMPSRDVITMEISV